MILSAQSDGVVTFTLSRPERLNALTESMIDDLIDKLRRASIDPTVRCVVLAGAGRAFCSGHDLSGGDEQASPRDIRPDEEVARLMEQAQLPVLLKRMPKPTIAVIRGAAAGSGLVLAAACDLRVASRAARFKLAFATAGRCGDPGGSFLLTKLVGSARARELFLLDPKIDGDQALAIGLIHRLVGEDEIEDTVTELARQLARGPTSAYAAMKRNLNAAEVSALEECIANEAMANVHASLSPDGKEAARAFLEKREPIFRGY